MVESPQKSSESSPARPTRPERKGRPGAAGKAGAPAALRFKTVRKVPDNFVPGMSLSSAKDPAVKKAAPPPPPPISAKRKESALLASKQQQMKRVAQPPSKQLPMQPSKPQCVTFNTSQQKNVQIKSQFAPAPAQKMQKPLPTKHQQPMAFQPNGGNASFGGAPQTPAGAGGEGSFNFASEILTMQQQMITNQQQQLQFLVQSQKLEQRKLGAQQQAQLQHAKSPQEKQALMQQHMQQREQMIISQQREQHELTQQHMKEMQLFMQRQQQMIQINNQSNFEFDGGDNGFGTSF